MAIKNQLKQEIWRENPVSIVPEIEKKEIENEEQENVKEEKKTIKKIFKKKK